MFRLSYSHLQTVTLKSFNMQLATSENYSSLLYLLIATVYQNVKCVIQKDKM